MRLFTRPNSCSCSLKSKFTIKRPSLACCSFKSKLISKPTSFSCCSFKSKNPISKKFFTCFKTKFKVKRRISVRCLKFRRNRPRISDTRNPIRKFLSLFRRKNRPPVRVTLRNNTRTSKFRLFSSLVIFKRRRRSSPTHHHPTSSEEESDEVGELRSVTCGTGEKDRELFPSPLTPAYVRNSGSNKRDIMGGGGGNDDVDIDEACRSFESYLVEMIIEEGKMKDLMDVEELLYCWKNLKSPVFINLVTRFYGELCKDLFLGYDQEEEEHNNPIHE